MSGSKSTRQYKLEPPDSPLYTPSLPYYNGGDDSVEEEDLENAQNRENRKFRCPFRREEDGMNCIKQDDCKVEILNHFYKFHFARICSGNVFEENLHCFFTRCYETFSTHDKLVKHMHKHDGGKESMFYIKCLIDNLEKEKKEAIDELKVASTGENIEMKKVLEDSKKENFKLVEKLNTTFDNKKKEFKEKESKLKEDVGYYKKKYDALKKEFDDDQKIGKEKDVKMKDLAHENETVKSDWSKLDKVHEDSQNLLNGKLSDLKERNAELRGKFSIQQENNIDLNSKLEKMKKKISDFGPDSESSLVQRNNKLEKQLELAKKQIRAKDAELKKKNDEVYRLTFPGSDDESTKPSNNVNPDQGEYVESE